MENVVVADEDGRDAVAGGGHEEGGLEADFEGARLDIMVPVEVFLVAESEVPFADEAGGVSSLEEEFGEGRGIGGDGERGVAREDAPCHVITERVLPGEEGVARGGADGGRRVGIGPAEAFIGEAVDVWSLEVFGVCAVAGEVAIAKVVDEDDDDVGVGRRGG